VALNSISSLSKTLRKLKIWSCDKLTNDGVLNAVVQLESLCYLNANTTSIDNSVLDKCVELDRKMYLCCNRTLINPKEFLRSHKNTSREILAGNIYIYKCKNLKFEVFVNSIYNNKSFNVKATDSSVSNPNEV
jgi:hypothetical protein